MYTGTEAQPSLKRYSSIKVFEYNVHTTDSVDKPATILQIIKLEVVKTSAVRDLRLAFFSVVVNL